MNDQNTKDMRARDYAVLALAARLHEAWRDEPSTDPAAFGARNRDAGRPKAAKVGSLNDVPEGPPNTAWVQDDVVMLDIARRTFAQLTPNWQAENLAAATAAVDQVMEATRSLSPDAGPADNTTRLSVRRAAIGVHDAWVARNPWADETLLRPYDDLPPNEQVKDVIHLAQAVAVLLDREVVEAGPLEVLAEAISEELRALRSPDNIPFPSMETEPGGRRGLCARLHGTISALRSTPPQVPGVVAQEKPHDDGDASPRRR